MADLHQEKAYKNWIRKVDAECAKEIGLSIHDLPDFHWRDLFDQGYRANEAFTQFQDEVLVEYEQ